MKKIAKLSLVAAVAVAGLTSANAGSLENAIKNTDISGQFRYRLQNLKKGSSSDTTTDVEVEVGAKVKVTDNVTAVFKIDSNPNKSDNDKSKDELKIEDYYFSYAEKGITVNFGQQNIPTRQVDGQQGDGIVALTKIGGFTVGGAYFVNNTVTTNSDVSSVLATGKVGPATLLAQFSNVQKTMDAVNVMASAKVAGVSISAEMATIEKDADTSKDYGTTKISVGGKVSNVALAAYYVTTEKDGSGSIDGESGAASEFETFQYGTANKKEASILAAKATVPVMDKTSVTLFALSGDYGKDTNGKQQDITEYYAQLTYKASKNLTTYVRYGSVDVDDNDSTTENKSDRSRIEVKYSF